MLTFPETFTCKKGLKVGKDTDIRFSWTVFFFFQWNKFSATVWPFVYTSCFIPLVLHLAYSGAWWKLLFCLLPPADTVLCIAPSRNWVLQAMNTLRDWSKLCEHVGLSTTAHISSACHVAENGRLPEAGCLPTTENTFSSEKNNKPLSILLVCTCAGCVLLWEGRGRNYDDLSSTSSPWL